MKRKKAKQTNKKSRAKSNLAYKRYFSFYKYHKTKELAVKLSFDSKQKDLEEFKIIEFFYHDTIEIKPNIKDHKVVLATTLN